ncbi:MAG: hypothetical protein RBS89_05365 [Candidatus Delongbacteria bacterium]|jgi:hypothetical protein|nr:hypothetical protein [Candidatus Delongbacteria bacterium]
MKKAIFFAAMSAVFFTFVSCSTSAEIRPPEITTRTLIATVIGQKGVLVGEFEDGSKVVEGNLSADAVTWEGWQLLLRTEQGQVYDHLSHEMFYEGDRLIIVVQDGKVLSAKFAP